MLLRRGEVLEIEFVDSKVAERGVKLCIDLQGFDVLGVGARQIALLRERDAQKIQCLEVARVSGKELVKYGNSLIQLPASNEGFRTPVQICVLR